MPNRLLIVQPSFYRSRNDRTVVRARRRDVVPLGLPYLAALTPPDWQVSLVDELLTPVNLDEPADLVAITTGTLNSLRAYDLSAEFRRRGKPVIMGGPHVFFFPEEAAQHADAVGIGEGEGLWRRMLEDAAAGRLQSLYRNEIASDLKGLPLPRHDLLDLRPYGWFKTFAVQSTRGCPFGCEFCSERIYPVGGYRCRPVAEVVEEIKQLGSRYVLFAESNFGGRRAHAMELMAAIEPLKLRWSTLWSLNLCQDREFMDLAQRSGLLHVNIGMESVEPGTLAGMNKRQNNTQRYAEILQDFRRRGISYSLNFIFGSDTETVGVFRNTLEFLRQQKVPVANFNVLRPNKGTAYYERMRQSGRILKEDEIGRWPGQACHIRPVFCSPEELEQRVQDLYRDFYSLPSIFARLPPPLTIANVASWKLNFSMYRTAKNLPESANFGTF